MNMCHYEDSIILKTIITNYIRVYNLNKLVLLLPHWTGTCINRIKTQDTQTVLTSPSEFVSIILVVVTSLFSFCADSSAEVEDSSS